MFLLVLFPSPPSVSVSVPVVKGWVLVLVVGHRVAGHGGVKHGDRGWHGDGREVKEGWRLSGGVLKMEGRVAVSVLL